MREDVLHFFLGSLFLVMGLLLSGYGAVSDPRLYERSLGWNVNLSWGGALFVVGLVFLVLWRRR